MKEADKTILIFRKLRPFKKAFHKFKIITVEISPEAILWVPRENFDLIPEHKKEKCKENYSREKFILPRDQINFATLTKNFFFRPGSCRK